MAIPVLVSRLLRLELEYGRHLILLNATFLHLILHDTNKQTRVGSSCDIVSNRRVLTGAYGVL